MTRSSFSRSSCALVVTACGLFTPCFAQYVTSYSISTVAGNAVSGFSGDNGAAVLGQLAGPIAITVDSSGKLYIADTNNSRIRLVTTAGVISTYAGTGTAGYSGDGTAATSSLIASPSGLAADSSGNLYFSDNRTHVIRKITSAGITSTIAGNFLRGPGFSGDGALATDAQLNGPTGIVLDKAGNIYFADTANNRIRKITGTTISTIAGGSTSGFSGDGGRAILARLNAPRGLAFDGLGNLYIADTGNNRIRKIDADNIITTVAGNGTAAFAGDGGPALSASFRSPYSVAVDSAGIIYVAEYLSSRIRRITLSGGISTIAGNGRFAYTGDEGPALNAALNFPSGLALGPNGRIYIADVQNNVIRMLTPGETSDAPAVDQGGVVTAAQFGAFTAAAPGSWIEIYGSNLATTARTWLGSDFKGVVAPTWIDGTSVTIGGQPAAISYVSSRQINAQVPSNVPAGAQDLIVTNDAGASKAYSLTVHDAEPGLYSPSQYVVGGKAYTGAQFTDYSSILIPGASPAVGTRRVRPGDIILLYGVGFGSVTPDTPSGQLVQRANTIIAPLQFFFGDVQATWSYAGLASNIVGLYQFNVLVPNVPASDAVPLTFSLNGKKGTQTLYIAVQ